MSVFDLIKTSRSYRSFNRDAVPTREELLSFVNAARLSPSSRNLQPLKFRIVTKEAECKRVLAATRWAGYLSDLQIPPVGHEPTAYIVVCFDLSLEKSALPFQRDVGICAQSILLAATEAGFGGCMIGSFSPEGICHDLKLPDTIAPQLVIALGRPDEVIELTEIGEDGSIKYYREDGIHYVPKRSIEEIVIE